MQKLGINPLIERLSILIMDLHEHEVIEIKQKGYIKGEISIVVKSTKKEDYCLNDQK